MLYALQYARATIFGKPHADVTRHTPAALTDLKVHQCTLNAD